MLRKSALSGSGASQRPGAESSRLPGMGAFPGMATERSTSSWLTMSTRPRCRRAAPRPAPPRARSRGLGAGLRSVPRSSSSSAVSAVKCELLVLACRALALSRTWLCGVKRFGCGLCSERSGARDVGVNPGSGLARLTPRPAPKGRCGVASAAPLLLTGGLRCEANAAATSTSRTCSQYCCTSRRLAAAMGRGQGSSGPAAAVAAQAARPAASSVAESSGRSTSGLSNARASARRAWASMFRGVARGLGSSQNTRAKLCMSGSATRPAPMPSRRGCRLGPAIGCAAAAASGVGCSLVRRPVNRCGRGRVWMLACAAASCRYGRCPALRWMQMHPARSTPLRSMLLRRQRMG
mmetsp:Transcript_26531/g.82963  ORF Transcript_26531/g.82963 Transcript_26531/m.82963 type:complete len:351 (-) Transcript_26531:1195-2247(-)